MNSFNTELQETFFDMKNVANILKLKINGKFIGRNELFKLLRKNKVLQEGNNLPYKKFLLMGYFRVLKIEVERKNQYVKEGFKTQVSQSGIEFIKQLFDENIRRK